MRGARRSPEVRRSWLGGGWSWLAAPMIAAALACGGREEPDATTAPVEVAGPVRSVVRAVDRTFTIEDLRNAGWKKHKDFEVDTLPHARAAAFGFFNQRDVEVWLYDSHEDAVRHGTGPAEQAVARPPGQTDALIPAVNRYHAYAIVGNLVLLCEVELADCEGLVARLP